MSRRTWQPSCNVIKARRADGWKHTCDNAGCDAPGRHAIDDGEAIWIACDGCLPAGAEVVARMKRTTP